MEIVIRQNIDWMELKQNFKNAKPFNYVFIDDFFLPEIADTLSGEFPAYDSPEVIKYKNALEDKRTLNQWDKFPKTTYRAFNFFGKEFLENIRDLSDTPNLTFDFGLNGGGWHMHTQGGNNNVHLDYNLHPKLGEQRKINIIVYMTKDWNPEWNGGLEFWNNDEKTAQPTDIHCVIENKFNRAIIFDTTQNSWHGLPKQLNCPKDVIRKSLAGYYLRPAPENTEQRSRVLFAPREEQKNDEKVLELIKKRSDIIGSQQVYR